MAKPKENTEFPGVEGLPTSAKKFRQSPEIEGFYRFIYENDLQKEAFEILEGIIAKRKELKNSRKTKGKAVTK